MDWDRKNAWSGLIYPKKNECENEDEQIVRPHFHMHARYGWNLTGESPERTQ